MSARFPSCIGQFLLPLECLDPCQELCSTSISCTGIPQNERCHRSILVGSLRDPIIFYNHGNGPLRVFGASTVTLRARARHAYPLSGVVLRMSKIDESVFEQSTFPLVMVVASPPLQLAVLSAPSSDPHLPQSTPQSPIALHRGQQQGKYQSGLRNQCLCISRPGKLHFGF